MIFTKEKIEAINKKFYEKKRQQPIKAHVVGLGVELTAGLNGASVKKDCMVFATVEELGRLIKELQMLKDSIEEETGLII